MARVANDPAHEPTAPTTVAPALAKPAYRLPHLTSSGSAARQACTGQRLGVESPPFTARPHLIYPEPIVWICVSTPMTSSPPFALLCRKTSAVAILPRS